MVKLYQGSQSATDLQGSGGAGLQEHALRDRVDDALLGDQEYLKINPLGKVPTLVDGEFTLDDSKVICRHLESAYPEPPLYPSKVKDRALADLSIVSPFINAGYAGYEIDPERCR